jgi:hypothetical protein
MDQHEKVALKAACIQAAATLIAWLGPPPTPPGGFAARQETRAADTGNCARYARDLFGKLTNEPWE